MKVAIVVLTAGVANAAPQLLGGLLSGGSSSGGGSAPPAPGTLKPTKSTMLSTISSLKGADGELDAGLRPLVRNEIVDNTPCGKVSFIWARASQEPDNMGGSMGPWVCSGLKKEFGESAVLCQGVSKKGLTGGYQAGLLDNASLGTGTSRSAITEATSMFTRANSKCPSAIIVFGGYSQGTAVMHSTVGDLPATIKNKIAGGVLFGDTRNVQDRGQVPNYPKDKVRIYCTSDDGVCKGTLSVTNGHFAYTENGDGNRAVQFLVSQIKAAGGGAATSAASSATAAAPASSMDGMDMSSGSMDTMSTGSSTSSGSLLSGLRGGSSGGSLLDRLKGLRGGN